MRKLGIFVFFAMILGLFAQAMIRLFMVDPTPAIIIPIVLIVIGWGLWSLEDF